MRLLFTMFLVPLLLVPTVVFGADLSQGEKDTIFLGELKVQPSVVESAEARGTSLELKRIVQSLDAQFIASLNATRVFHLVERTRMGEIEREQQFVAGAVDPDDKNAAQTGKMAGAKFVFLPQIDGFQDKTAIIEQKAIGRRTVKREIFLSAVVRIVDTTTGRILPNSPSVQLTHRDEARNLRPEELELSDVPLVSLAKEMAKKLAKESVSLMRPAKVLAVTGKQVVINRGSEADFKKGDLVEIFTVQNVKDDDTGELFRNEIPVGQAIITRVDRNQSYATMTGEDLGIIKGCTVRFAKSASDRKAEDIPEPDPTKPDFEQQGGGDPNPASSEKPLHWK